MGLLTILVLFVTMVYGPIAAMLVELFPTRIRYTALSLPYHPAHDGRVIQRMRPVTALMAS